MREEVRYLAAQFKSRFSLMLFYIRGLESIACLICLLMMHAGCSTAIRPLILCASLENEPSVYDLQSSGGAPPVGGFIYRGCQSRRLYGSYVFGDKNG